MEYIRKWLEGRRLTKCNKCERKLWVKKKNVKNFICSRHNF